MCELPASAGRVGAAAGSESSRPLLSSSHVRCERASLPGRAVVLEVVFQALIPSFTMPTAVGREELQQAESFCVLFPFPATSFVPRRCCGSRPCDPCSEWKEIHPCGVTTAAGACSGTRSVVIGILCRDRDPSVASKTRAKASFVCPYRPSGAGAKQWCREQLPMGGQLRNPIRGTFSATFCLSRSEGWLGL